MKPPSGGPITGPTSAGTVTQAIGIDQRALVDRAQQHQPADRRHHRAAEALQDARDHEIGDGGGQCAADRAHHEDGDRDA